MLALSPPAHLFTLGNQPRVDNLGFAVATKRTKQSKTSREIEAVFYSTVVSKGGFLMFVAAVNSRGHLFQRGRTREGLYTRGALSR